VTPGVGAAARPGPNPVVVRIRLLQRRAASLDSRHEPFYIGNDLPFGLYAELRGEDETPTTE
jgi:hypothetical protein